MKPVIDIEGIKAIIPHRSPFLLVDRITEIREGKGITGIKNVTANEAFFQGHFPVKSVMPGVLIIEAMAQTAGVLVLREEEYKGKLAYFAAINNAKFRKPVVPGDTIVMDCDMTNRRARIVQFHCVAKIDGEIASEADLMFAIMAEGQDE